MRAGGAKLRRAYEQRLLRAVRILNGSHQKDWTELARHYPEMPTRRPSLGSAYGDPSRRLSEELRRYVDTWLSAKRRYVDWQRRNPALSGLLRSALFQTVWDLKPVADGAAVLIPRRRVTSGPLESGVPVTFIARWEFAGIVTNPYRGRVGRCARCSRYFVATTRHAKKFCTRRCASAESAQRRTQKRREQERKAKLTDAREALWSLAAMKLHVANWRAWVAERAGVSPTWLTRALHRGEQGKAGGLVLSKRLRQYLGSLKPERKLLTDARR